jgi:hypothetical protein
MVIEIGYTNPVPNTLPHCSMIWKLQRGKKKAGQSPLFFVIENSLFVDC